MSNVDFWSIGKTEQKIIKKQQQSNVPLTKTQKAVGNFFRKNLMTDVADWIEEKDKYCTDGKDDGKISVKEGIISAARGFFGGVIKEVVKHPVATVVAVGVGAVAVAATGGAILPAMVAVGATVSAGTIAYGAHKVAKAKTDKEAKEACETIGVGAFGLVTSALSAKNALIKGANAGVESAKQVKNAGVVKSLIQCFKSTPESLKVSGQNIAKTAKAISSTAKLVASGLKLKNSTPAENLENEKTILGFKIENNIRKSTELSVNSSRFQDKSLQENLLKSINEENVDLAKQLINQHHENGMCASNYVVERDAYSDYILRSVPKVLKSTDPKVHEAAKYIIGCKDISDKFHAIKILNSSNAQDIMNLRSQVIDGKYYSIQQLLWKKYPIYVEPPRVLPHIATNDGIISGSGKNLFNLKIFGEKGKIPKVPGAHPLIDAKTKQPDFNHYVIYEETAERIRFWDAMDKANALIDKYGYQ